MEQSREQLDFLQECELEFKNRYTDADEDFFKIKCSTLTNPPILDPWPCDTQKSKNKNQRDSSDIRHSQRRDYGRANGRYKEDRYRDGRRKKQKMRSRNERERSRERSADRRREKDERRSAGRKRRKHRKRSEDRSKGYSHRDEERDRRHRDEERDRRHRTDNKKRDDHYYQDRDRSRDRQRHRERDFDGKKYEEKRKDAEKCVRNSPEISKSFVPRNSQNNEQDLWTMYVSKHNLYENYRPYF